MNYGKEYYPNAVFASDKSLQKFDWPIKSGYYFNPLGEYTCTVKTVQYKDTPDSTNEHTELVEKSKNSFHYTSNMLYTSDGKNYQHLDLHNGNDKIFGMDMLDITTTYDKADTKLEHFNNSAYADKTHQFFKEILEGYSESNTENSKTNFKYREYIKQGDIYKVEETTVITFRVSPKNQKLYTYINIKDGEYLINARIDNFTLNNYAYKGLTVNGLSSIDNITVNVEGTLYDDQNAIIR
jgi:anthranilate/para-aminobenzoate synthase component I